MVSETILLDEWAERPGLTPRELLAIEADEIAEPPDFWNRMYALITALADEPRELMPGYVPPAASRLFLRCAEGCTVEELAQCLGITFRELLDIEAGAPEPAGFRDRLYAVLKQLADEKDSRRPQ